MCDATWAGGGAQRGGELDAESVPQTVQAPQDHGPDSNPKDADIKDSDCSSAAAVANEANTTLLATGEVLTQATLIEMYEERRGVPLHTWLRYRCPQHKPYKSASRMLPLEAEQHAIMYAIAGCSDVRNALSCLSQATRAALERDGIDKSLMRTWFKNRRLAPNKRKQRARAASAGPAAPPPPQALRGANPGDGADVPETASPLAGSKHGSPMVDRLSAKRQTVSDDRSAWQPGGRPHASPQAIDGNDSSGTIASQLRGPAASLDLGMLSVRVRFSRCCGL
uniref:Uncharacterized protein n=1 Tax=Chlamydomonas euryale TaxID=1486919 RepID=A0A7R9V5H1_9CHLO|mmetsp:Transcript_20946/g.62651  ORF Transcript_20946/g.62651 Transcript_20946/m.62651 type:complete len:281 (+) Transcript_20946:305-1147(+)